MIELGYEKLNEDFNYRNNTNLLKAQNIIIRNISKKLEMDMNNENEHNIIELSYELDSN